ncbi:MAG TPA: DUF488 domain-containing protein [Sphingomicrobium sp.]|nr:DUF488 domain-containing protein [Sphingomicrobium sp.]
MSTPAANIKIKRAYEPAEADDGARVLVDRLWPRGISKQEASLYQWNRELAPSPELRKWFGHQVSRWPEFSRRYRLELARHAEALTELRRRVQKGPVTLVYAAKDERHNHAIVLRSVLLGRGDRREEALHG